MAKQKKVGKKRPLVAKRRPSKPSRSVAKRRPGASRPSAAKPSKKDGKSVKKPVPEKKPAKAAAPPPVVAPPAVLAPPAFRREYRRWKELLISLRHRLLSEGSHLEEEGLKALEQEVSVDHMADFGSDSSEQETTLQLIESNSLSLRDVDDALKRIEAKNYGLCEDCEQLIPSARLGVLPHARFCIDCKQREEDGKK